MIWTVLVIAWLGDPRTAAANGNTEQEDEIRQLREEISRLRAEYESRIAGLEKAIERLGAGSETESGPAAAPALRPMAIRGNQMNPRISVIGNFIVDWVEDRDESLDWELSEAEIGFQAEVDPYLRFDLYAALEQHGEERPIIPLGVLAAADPEDDLEEHGGEIQVDLEEAYVTTLALPAGLQLRAGKFLQRMGRNNLVHGPEDPWVDLPTISEAYFGDHGHSGTGVELSWLLPTPFYWELAGAITDGPGESPTFASGGHDDFHYLLHNKFFFDLSPVSTIQLGQSWARGPGTSDGREKSEVLGADITWKWIPGNNRGLTWQTEIFSRRVPVPASPSDLARDQIELAQRELEGRTPHAEDWGGYTWLQYRFSKRWFSGIRIDYVDYDPAFFDSGVSSRWDVSSVVEYWPSEFQTLRFQYKRTRDDLVGHDLDSLYLNWVWVMGAHGSHAY